MKSIFVFSLLFLMGFQAPAFANPNLEMKVNELSQMVMDLKQTVAVQQKEIDLLKSGQGWNVQGSQTAAPATAAIPSRPSSASQGRWNPDIGVIADTLFKHDTPKEDTEGSDRISVRELELVMGSYVDPYSRLDVNIAFSDFEDVHIQEAYLTRFGLPLETTARIGRFKPRVGKALLNHRDVLDTTDYPLVIQRYFGSDGLSKTGLDFTKPINLPVDSAHEVSFGVLEGGNGEGGTAFGESRRRPTVYSHLKNFWDLGDVSNFELGASHMLGSQDADAGMETNILGLDGTLIHFYGPDQRIKLQSELFYMNQNQMTDENRFGTYGLLDIKFHKRWSAGTRIDYAELVEGALTAPGTHDMGYTGYITFHQSELAKWRLQFSRIEKEDRKDDNQIMIQGIFAIGEHKHKLQ